MERVIPSTSTHDSFVAYTRELQQQILEEFATVETVPFERADWTRAGLGGGGHACTVRGDTIEKGAVLTSHVWADSNPLTGNPYRAAGLSVILHPRNPHAPSVHLNVRHFHEDKQSWWGGALDINPLGVRHASDIVHFHRTLQRSLGGAYEEGKSAAERYFYLPHRGRTRGAGGVFYDHLDTGDAAMDYALIRRIGDTFVEAYLPILRRRKDYAYSERERALQTRERGMYVEFNLLYDRGTRFGLESGGDPDVILSSLPPLAGW